MRSCGVYLHGNCMQASTACVQSAKRESAKCKVQMRCTDKMKRHLWLTSCQSACTRPCREVRYRGLVFRTGVAKDTADK
ncbi:hypothetical protein V5799_016641 [Amblyomma americanum]|uniref:Uncharacterized protein n=1 Tax=Amblyomma americanum TaxID=6943 RepID=A0AAQ4F4J6_AMBAM